MENTEFVLNWPNFDLESSHIESAIKELNESFKEPLSTEIQCTIDTKYSAISLIKCPIKQESVNEAQSQSSGEFIWEIRFCKLSRY